MSKALFGFISLVSFIAGLILIFGSVRWGNNATSAFIASHGGSIDISVFTIILQEYISEYRWAGSILSIIGGLGFVKMIELK
jgi:hypothetical protein